jgi:hypothetical protein
MFPGREKLASGRDGQERPASAPGFLCGSFAPFARKNAFPEFLGKHAKNASSNLDAKATPSTGFWCALDKSKPAA